MEIRAIVKKLLGVRQKTSAEHLDELRAAGAHIGERTFVFASWDQVVIDGTRPWLLNLGDDVQITKGVTILTHGYDWSVLKGVYGDVCGSAGRVTIGNNVFIGMNATILKGVTIGSNVIIGAGSVVTHDIPDNCVAAGNPCKVIMSLEAYHEKRLAAQYQEAAELVKMYRATYHREPDDAALAEFHWLYSDSMDGLPEEYMRKNRLVGGEKVSRRVMRERKPMFPNKEAFLASVR